MGQCLRPSSDDFPKLAVRHSPGPTRVRESERVVGETITTKTEEYTEEETGLVKVRTVEIVEKLIEKEVLGSFFCTACLQHCFNMLADLDIYSVCSITSFSVLHITDGCQNCVFVLFSHEYSKGHSLPSPLFYRLTLRKSGLSKVSCSHSISFVFF